MFVYIVICLSIGLGDSRKMTNLSDAVSDIIIFGGAIYMIYKIRYYKKMIQDKDKILHQYRVESDERNQFLRDKSGGIVVEILILILLLATCTFELFNMTAFYVSFIILIITILLKYICYKVYDKLT
jgi:Flp pilus assembly protein TadG